MQRMPPLNSLRAFESAGRHLSFSLAAEELNVTPGAISQQIRVLEDHLEIKLFERLNRSIQLTDAGRMYLPLISQGFEQLLSATQNLINFSCGGPLTVTSAPSLISKWLIPRLGKFKQEHPEIDVRIDASERLVDFFREDIDIGIRFGTGEFEGLDAIELFCVEIIAVCSPDLLRKGNGLNNIEDIAQHTLLHSEFNESDPGFPDWKMWLATFGAKDIDTNHGITFKQSEMLLQAAIEGQGIGLVTSVIAEREIAEGRLVQLFQTSLPNRMSYHLVSTPQKSDLGKVVAFREWILRESAHLRDSEDQES